MHFKYHQSLFIPRPLWAEIEFIFGHGTDKGQRKVQMSESTGGYVSPIPLSLGPRTILAPSRAWKIAFAPKNLSILTRFCECATSDLQPCSRHGPKSISDKFDGDRMTRNFWDFLNFIQMHNVRTCVLHFDYKLHESDLLRVWPARQARPHSKNHKNNGLIVK